MGPNHIGRALGIVGSPRRGGNTEILVDEALRGARDAGALVEKVVLADFNIAPCLGCQGCWSNGQCVQQDDMPALLEQMERSQVWVLSTPIYYNGPTAQFKAFEDRWYVKTDGDPRGRSMFKGRKVILAIPFGNSDPHQADHVVAMLTETLAYFGAKLFAVVLAPGIDQAGMVRHRPEVLAAAYRAGREAINDRR